MSGLAALLAGHTPPGVYRWHSAASVADIQHAVEHAGWTFRLLDGWVVEDKETFLKAVSASLQFPGHLGEDLDGLTGGLDELDMGENGTVLLWDGWSPLARQDEPTFSQVLSIFGRRTGSDRGRLAVLLRGEGPEVELEELPIRR